MTLKINSDISSSHTKQISIWQIKTVHRRQDYKSKQRRHMSLGHTSSNTFYVNTQQNWKLITIIIKEGVIHCWQKCSPIYKSMVTRTHKNTHRHTLHNCSHDCFLVPQNNSCCILLCETINNCSVKSVQRLKSNTNVYRRIWSTTQIFMYHYVQLAVYP